MNKSFWIVPCLLLWGGLNAQAPIEATSKLTEATVFLQNAQLTREAQVSLNKGDNVLRFTGLETGIDPNSIQAAAPDLVLINSVRHEVNYLRDLPKSPEYKGVEDSLQLIDDAIKRNAAAQTVIEQERQMILSNQAIASKERGLTTEALQKMADFFRTRMGYLQQEQFKRSIELRELQKTQGRLGQQFSQLQGKRDQPSNTIVVTLKSEYARTITVLFRYVVSGANWVPAYDLRAADLTKPVRLDYRAEVSQATGVDWKDVKLTLSTGNPNLGGTKPELQQWNLYVQTYADGKYKNKTEGSYRSYAADESGNVDGYYDANDLDGLTLADYTTMTEGAVTAEFAIGLPQSIPADGKGHQVFIQSTDLPAQFRHFAVPKLDDDAFLLAAVTGWENLNLLPGTVNIFFEGTYVTRSHLNPSLTSDTLNFSLGRDPKIVIKREVLKDHNSQRTIGVNRERTFGYEIVVRNTKNVPVNLRLLDQVPVSQDASVIVKVGEISGAEQNPNTGELTWNLVLQPNETKKLRLVYSVKYPKNKVVSGI